ETTGESIRWLVAEHRDLVDAEFALNTDGGGGDYRDGKPIRFNVQAAEKVYQSFTLEVRNKGGHSSRPVPDNAIYHLARGLARLADYQFPVRLNEVTRAFFSRAADAHPSPPSPLTPNVMGPVESLAQKYWPGVPVVPEMSTGASDGLYTRNGGIPTYGVGAVFDDINDSRAHGRDERVGVKEYHQAAEYWYELVKRLAGGPAS